jgi:hypothetical protein
MRGGDIMKVTINLPYIEHVGRAAKKVVAYPKKRTEQAIVNTFSAALIQLANNVKAAEETKS